MSIGTERHRLVKEAVLKAHPDADRLSVQTVGYERTARGTAVRMEVIFDLPAEAKA